MIKTYLYTLDHEQFRALVGSGERGLAQRLLRRHHELGGTRHEAELDELQDILREIETRGAVVATGDAKTDDLVNHAVWLVAEEAGVDAVTAGASTDLFAQAEEILTSRGWFRRPIVAGRAADLLGAIHRGRVYGGIEAWSGGIRTAILEPAEVKQLLATLRAVADNHGNRLASPLQDLLDNQIFPALEAAARAKLGLLAITRRMQ